MEKLNIIKISRSELIVALLSGKVDAIFISDVAVRFAGLADQIVRGISLADIFPNHQVSFIVFGARLLDDNPEAGIKFLSAYLRGAVEYVGGKTPKFFDDLAASNGMDPVVTRNVCRDSLVPDGRIDLPSLDRFVQWAVAKGFCPVPVHGAQLVDMRFLQRQGQYQKQERAITPVVGLQMTEAP